MARTWAFANKIRLGFLILGLMALLISLASIVILQSITHNSDEIISRYNRKLLLIEQLNTLFERSLGASRGYLLTHQPEFSRHYEEARRGYAEVLEELDEPFGPELADLKRVGEELDLGLDALGSGSEVFSSDWVRERFSTALERLKNRESQLLRASEQNSQISAHRALEELTAIGLGGLLVIFGLTLLVNRLLDDSKRVEQELRASEAKFRILVNGARDHALFMLDSYGRIISWNAGAERLTGYRADEVLGTGIRRFFLQEDILAGKLEEMTQLALLEGSHESEGWRLRRDGSRFWANSLVTALRDEQGGITGYSVVTRDRTEHQRQKITQEFLMEASDCFARSLDYRATLSTVAKLVVPRVADHCVIYVRERADAPDSYLELACADPSKTEHVREMLEKYSPFQGRGAVNRILSFSQSILDSVIDEEWYENNAVNDEHREMLKKMGIKSMMVVPIFASGKVRGVLGFASETQYYSLQDLALANEIGRRAGSAIENATLYLEARTAISVRDEFLSIASHELKTPLTSLYLQLQLLQRSAQAQLVSRQPGTGVTEMSKFGLSPESTSLMLDSCRLQSKRLGKLIDELLDLTRIRSGKFELKLGPVDVAGVVREVINRLGADIMQAGSILTVELPHSQAQDAAQAAVGSWDKTRVEQVITNLLSNAVKYGEGKPIHVKLERDDKLALARLSVRDEGIGISPESQKRIFERFERAVNSRHISGLGLGLYIVRQIVEALGGKIRVESTPGKGSTFTVELPIGEFQNSRIPIQVLRKSDSGGAAPAVSS